MGDVLYSVRAKLIPKVNLKLYLHKINTWLIYDGMKKYSRVSLLYNKTGISHNRLNKQVVSLKAVENVFLVSDKVIVL